MCASITCQYNMRPNYVVAPTNIPFHMNKHKIFCPILEDYILNNFSIYAHWHLGMKFIFNLTKICIVNHNISH